MQRVGFTFERLILSGLGKEDGVITFEPGLNIVMGPSNTGKSMIMESIDYLFGFREKPENPFSFDHTLGYSVFTLALRTRKGSVILRRTLGETKITVSGTDSDIQNGEYSTSGSTNNISTVWLKLIGIKKQHDILSTQTGKTQHLTWRGIMHLFYVKQDYVSKKETLILRPKEFMSRIMPSLSSLLFLLTGHDAANITTPEDKRIKDAKKKAVLAYINESINRLAVRVEELEEQTSKQSIPDINAAIAIVVAQINELQAKIDAAISESQSLMEAIYTANTKISEYDTIKERFLILRDQYHADINRLAFVVDSELKQSSVPVPSMCPFCNGEIAHEQQVSYIDATRAELAHITTHLTELEKANNDIINQRKAVAMEIAMLEQRKHAADDLVKRTLAPQIAALKNELAQYKRAVEHAKEIDFAKSEKIRYEADLFQRQMAAEEADQVKYDIKDDYEFDVIQGIQNKLIGILKAIRFPGAATARLNLDTFDIMINGRDKAKMGGGYRGILNAVMALALMEYLHDEGAYAPGVLLVDSCLSQLSESEYTEDIELIRGSFIRYLVDHNSNGQIIIIDHKDKIPSWIFEEKDVHIEEFTENREHGRYGLLPGVYNQ